MLNNQSVTVSNNVLAIYIMLRAGTLFALITPILLCIIIAASTRMEKQIRLVPIGYTSNMIGWIKYGPDENITANIDYTVVGFAVILTMRGHQSFSDA
jgi:hypothetical protein